MQVDVLRWMNGRLELAFAVKLEILGSMYVI